LNFFDGFWELHLLHFFVGNLSEVSSEKYHGGLRLGCKVTGIHRRSEIDLFFCFQKIPGRKCRRHFLTQNLWYTKTNVARWNEGVDNSAQKVLHMNDLLMMANPAYAQNRTIKWMILGEEV